MSESIVTITITLPMAATEITPEIRDALAALADAMLVQAEDGLEDPDTGDILATFGPNQAVTLTLS